MKAALLLCVLLTGCWKELSDLAPYPCPQDGVCGNDPSLACIAGMCQRFQACGLSSSSGKGTPSCPATGNTRCALLLAGRNNVATACVPPSGPREGTPCTLTLPPAEAGALRAPAVADSECGDGHVCFSAFFDPAAPAICRRFCSRDSDCDTTTDACVQVVLPAGPGPNAPNGALNAGVCQPFCDLFAAGACPTGQQCTLVQGFGKSFGVCAIPGTAREGDTCSNWPQGGLLAPVICSAGLSCFAEGTFRCRHLCRPGVPGDCPANETCQAGQAGAAPCASNNICECR